MCWECRDGRLITQVHSPAEHIELDLVRRLTTPQVEELMQHVTHQRYRIRRP